MLKTNSFLFTLLFLISVSFSFAQPARLSDSTRVQKLLERATRIGLDSQNSDSVEILADEALAISQNAGYDDGTRQAVALLADFNFLRGRLSRSLNYLLSNEERAIQKGDTVTLFNILRSEASLYLRIGDVNMLRNVLMRRQYILDNNGIKDLKDTSYQVLSQYNNLAQYYNLKQVGKPDSVMYYYQKMKLLGPRTERANLWEQLSNGGIGNFYLTVNLYDSAIYHLRVAMAAAEAGKRTDNRYGYIVSLAKAYEQTGQADSAFKYAYYLQNNAVKFGYKSILASSSGILAKLYTNQQKYDSAVKYLMLESRYKDSVTGVETLNSIQGITSDYQLKTREREREKEAAVNEYKTRIKNYLYGGGILLLLLVIAAMYRVNKQRARAKRTIEKAYMDLKNTQAQLLHSEKMASLGELTAGIAHEIQNPLNFVNNFSEISRELVDELKLENKKLKADRNDQIEKELLNDIDTNLEKISHHGKRAEAIVKGMLQHSRSSSGQKEPTDINALCDEYLRLSYHGLRAKDKSFNASFKTDFDPTAGTIDIIPQDIGRVIMNLLTNAFYVPAARNAEVPAQPDVLISTKRNGNNLEIKVSDKGPGIPADIVGKIFQPFFTTKPTGQGTGLGLSLSYDIVKAHGGNLAVETKENEGSTFIVTLPSSNAG